MEIIRKISEIRSALRRVRSSGKRIGLVPTMGYFHKGHLSLIDIARRKSDFVVVSLFVNPTQFAPQEDLDRYPRDLSHDKKLAADHGVDILFYPTTKEMYAAEFKTYVITEDLSRVLCGRTRKTHFRGVTTVVAKLFNIIQPDLAVFGQKDHQQAVIIKRMVADLNFPVQIEIGPIIREPNGLAMSSRNRYLSALEREQATWIYRSLKAAQAAVAQGERDPSKITEIIRKKIKQASRAEIEYIALVDDQTLERVDRIRAGTFAAVAVYFNKTRLIDNVYLLK